MAGAVFERPGWSCPGRLAVALLAPCCGGRARRRDAPRRGRRAPTATVAATPPAAGSTGGILPVEIARLRATPAATSSTAPGPMPRRSSCVAAYSLPIRMARCEEDGDSAMKVTRKHRSTTERRSLPRHRGWSGHTAWLARQLDHELPRLGAELWRQKGGYGRPSSGNGRAEKRMSPVSCVANR